MSILWKLSFIKSRSVIFLLKVFFLAFFRSVYFFSYFCILASASNFEERVTKGIKRSIFLSILLRDPSSKIKICGGAFTNFKKESKQMEANTTLFLFTNKKTQ